MKKVNLYPFLYIYTKTLNEMSQKEIDNLTAFILSVTDTFGIVAQRFPNGVLSGDLSLQVVPPANVMLGGGRIIVDTIGGIKLINVSSHSYTGSSFSLGVNYVYIVPRTRTTEQGLLTFTPGSTTVAIVGGNFGKVNPYETLSTILGNFKVSESISESSLELAEPYMGTYRDDIEFTLLGYYPNQTVNPSAIYEYDDYDIVISPSPSLGQGMLLGSITKIEGGFMTLTADYRENSLYRIKGVHQINADAVDSGLINAITTLDEKYNAYSQSQFVKDFFSKGVRIGFAPSLNEITNDTELIITAGSAYGGNGRRIVIPTSTTILLGANTSVGMNYVYVNYKDYGSGQIVITKAQTDGDDYVLICRVKRVSNSRPPYVLSDGRSFTKFKVSGFTSEGRSEGYGAGDLYYKPISNGNGGYFYQRVKADGTGLEEIELMNYLRVLTEIQNGISAIVKKERLRFILYPEAGNIKDGWLLHQGAASPTIVGYQFKIDKVSVGIAPAVAFNPDEILVSDFAAHIANLAVAKTATYSFIGAKSYDNDGYNANSFLGLYYNHASGKVELIINGAVVDSNISLGIISGNQTIIIEVEIENLEGVILAQER